jgi:hypothetical protein
MRVDELDAVCARRCPFKMVLCGAAFLGLCHSACIDISSGRQMHALIENELEYEKIIPIDICDH